MTNLDILHKLIGSITPYGSTEIDNVRFENLKEMCVIVTDIILEIEEVANYKERQEHSMKQMGEYADNFLKNLLQFENEKKNVNL